MRNAYGFGVIRFIKLKMKYFYVDDFKAELSSEFF